MPMLSQYAASIMLSPHSLNQHLGPFLFVQSALFVWEVSNIHKRNCIFTLCVHFV